MPAAINPANIAIKGEIDCCITGSHTAHTAIATPWKPVNQEQSEQHLRDRVVPEQRKVVEHDAARGVELPGQPARDREAGHDHERKQQLQLQQKVERHQRGVDGIRSAAHLTRQ